MIFLWLCEEANLGAPGRAGALARKTLTLTLAFIQPLSPLCHGQTSDKLDGRCPGLGFNQAIHIGTPTSFSAPGAHACIFLFFSLAFDSRIVWFLQCHCASHPNRSPLTHMVEGRCSARSLLLVPQPLSPLSCFPLDTVETICSLVEAIHQQFADILAAKAKPGPGCASSPAEPPDTIDIDFKFREHLAVPVLDSSSLYSNPRPSGPPAGV
jgi:hypothetical protein